MNSGIIGKMTAAVFAVACMASVLHCSLSVAQEKIGDVVEFDKTIHNFGDVLLSDGPLAYTFTMKNISCARISPTGETMYMLPDWTILTQNGNLLLKK